MYAIVTLDEIKQWLGLTGTSKDDFLKTLQFAATSIAEKYCGKQFITRRYIEDMDVDGNNDKRVRLNWYPVYINPAGDNFKMWNDPERQFGNDDLIDSSEYKIDEITGVIKLINRSLIKGIGVLRVDYWAGYSRFTVASTVNDRFKLTEAGTPYTIIVSDGEYNAEDLASAIQTAINGSGVANTYSVTYDHISQKFTISSSANFDLDFTVSYSIGGLIGFSGSLTGASSYTAQKSITGLPSAITIAGLHIVNRLWRLSKQGEGDFDLVRQMIEQGGTREYDRNPLPPMAASILQQYRRVVG